MGWPAHTGRMLIACQLPCMALGAEDAGYRLWCNANLQKRVRACVAAGRATKAGSRRRDLFTGRGRVSAVHQHEAPRRILIGEKAADEDARTSKHRCMVDLRGTQAKFQFRTTYLPVVQDQRNGWSRCSALMLRFLITRI